MARPVPRNNLDGGRSAVDIPVIAPMEACLHVAALLGDRFGLIIYHEKLLAFNRAIVRRYGMEERIVGFGVSGFDLPDLTAHREEVITNFVSEAERLISAGAEVIIPMGISQCPVHIDPQWLQEQLGVPVVEGFGAPIRIAGLLAGAGPLAPVLVGQGSSEEVGASLQEGVRLLP